MDFLKILQSLEEFLYEVMTWLLFYPKTLLRVILHPGSMADYADHELHDKEDDRFIDAVSPALFLMLSILIAHGIEVASHSSMFTPDSSFAKVLLGSEQNLLLYRAVMYSIWPLVASSVFLRKRKIAIDRKTLRRPFFTQCFLAAPFAITFSIGSAIQRDNWHEARYIGDGVMLFALIWYMVIQTIWFRQVLHKGWAGAAVYGVYVCMLGLVINLIVALVLMQ